MNKMEEEFLKFVANIMNVERDEINLYTAYKEFPPWDSMMFLRLVMEIEEEYDVSIPVEEFDGIHNLCDFYDLTKR